MTSKPDSAVDERLIGAHDLALAALREITPADGIGPAAGYVAEDDGVVSLRFHTRLAGYPGWFWTVSVAVVDDAEPTVLEVELLPGDGALLAPDWVPWATRLAEYQAAQVAAQNDELEEGDEEGDDDDDLDADADTDEDDDLPKARFHAGDLDGVDIDELDDDATAVVRDARMAAGDDDDESEDDESEDDDDAPFDEEDDVHGGEDRSY